MNTNNAAGTGNGSGNPSLPWHRRKPARPEDEKKKRRKEKTYSPHLIALPPQEWPEKTFLFISFFKLPMISTAKYNSSFAGKVKNFSGGAKFFQQNSRLFMKGRLFLAIHTPLFAERNSFYATNPAAGGGGRAASAAGNRRYTAMPPPIVGHTRGRQQYPPGGCGRTPRKVRHFF